MRRVTLSFLCFAGALLLAVSCASMGNPSGGPRDEDPPRFVSASPAQGAVEVSPSKAVLTFNELIQLKDAFSKVVVSPPSANMPRVSSLGRNVTVDFQDTLLPNTTYTVDFGDAIQDNNEGNKLTDFFYTFSTGPVLDSLMVSGMVLGAEDLEPARGIYVGLHSNPADSAFTKTRFDRIAKTDDEGRFVIGGLPEGQYRVYALDDRDGNLAWSSPEETLAFLDMAVFPTSEQTETTDTIFNLKTGEVDSVVNRVRTRFMPNNILLRSYNTGFKQQYITTYERLDSTRIHLLLNASADSMPEITVLLPDEGGVKGRGFPAEEVAVVERSATNDSINLWLRSPELISTDSLRVAIRYLRADSAYNMVPVADTLRVYTKRMPVKATKVKKDDKKKKEAADTLPPPVPTIELKALNTRVEVNSQLWLESPFPLEEFDRSMVRLEWKEDTLWVPVEGFSGEALKFDTLNPRRMKIEFPWQYETSYKLTVDSLAGRSIYGLFTDDLTHEFKIRPETDYGSLKFNLTNMGTDSLPRLVQLLDASGKAMKSSPVEADGSVTFDFLLAGKYNARVVVDRNGDGLWTPGTFELGIQPDVSYYYPETIDLKSNWSQELDWDVFATPVDRQKPSSLRTKSRSTR